MKRTGKGLLIAALCAVGLLIGLLLAPLNKAKLTYVDSDDKIHHPLAYYHHKLLYLDLDSHAPDAFVRLHDIETKETTELGTIEHFVLSSRGDVLTGGVYYFYAATAKGDGMTNRLYRIDLDAGRLTELQEDALCDHNVLLTGREGALFALKGRKLNERTYETYIEKIQVDGDTASARAVYSVQYEIGAVKGPVIHTFYSRDGVIYLVVEERDTVDRQGQLALWELNESGQITRRVSLEPYSDLAAARIGVLHVFGDRAFLLNRSNAGMLGTVAGDAFEPLWTSGPLEEVGMIDLSVCIDGADNPVYFAREGKTLFQFDETDAQPRRWEFGLPKDCSIAYLLQDGEGLLIALQSGDRRVTFTTTVDALSRITWWDMARLLLHR